MTSYIALSPADLILASLFLVLNAILSIALRLQIRFQLINHLFDDCLDFAQMP